MQRRPGAKNLKWLDNLSFYSDRGIRVENTRSKISFFFKRPKLSAKLIISFSRKGKKNCCKCVWGIDQRSTYQRKNIFYSHPSRVPPSYYFFVSFGHKTNFKFLVLFSLGQQLRNLFSLLHTCAPDFFQGGGGNICRPHF
jgi:hypothetical protein